MTQAIFLTPSIDGWVLAVLTASIADAKSLDLASLSREYGEAQKFGSHRVSDYYEWQRWVNGSPVRRYAWIGDEGELLYDDGEPADAEEGLVRRENLDSDCAELKFPDEDAVLNVAGEWSLDPMEVGSRLARGSALLGYVPKAANT